MTKSMEKSYDEHDISESWKNKFRIFDKAGSFNGLTFENYKLLSFKERRKIGFNSFAFLFGYFYYFTKKMHHKGAFILGVSFIYSSILVLVENYANIVFYQPVYWVPISSIVGSIASYDYYKFITKKEKIWSILPNFFSKTFGAFTFPIIGLLLYLASLGVFSDISTLTSKIQNQSTFFNTKSSETIYIDLVKNGVMSFNKTLSVGEAFDNWENCEKKKWKSFKTDNGINVVEFSCSQKNVEKFTYKLKSLLPNKDQIDTSFLDVLSSTQIFQFTINKDDTFQIDNAQVETVWKDGSKYSDSLNQIEIIERAYNNELTYNVDILDRVDNSDINILLNLFANMWRDSVKSLNENNIKNDMKTNNNKIKTSTYINNLYKEILTDYIGVSEKKLIQDFGEAFEVDNASAEGKFWPGLTLDNHLEYIYKFADGQLSFYINKYNGNSSAIQVEKKAKSNINIKVPNLPNITLGNTSFKDLFSIGEPSYCYANWGTDPRSQFAECTFDFKRYGNYKTYTFGVRSFNSAGTEEEIGKDYKILGSLKPSYVIIE